MFEYLMPLIVTENYPETLLYETCRAVVERQIEYGEENGVPWGVSESAYHARDLQMNYQYGPFGVPGLGIKRGLSEELVIAPYATCLAAMIDPKAALENILRLEEAGALTRYGLYEAIDYTPDRLPRNSTEILIRSFMTHHQGMCLVSLENTLFSGSMRRRFHADPIIQATELLLQERVAPNVPIVEVRGEEVVQGRLESTLLEPVAVAYDSANLPTPRTQLISNGRYSVLVTTAGSGSSTCVVPGGSIAVTRWREDVTRDDLGTFIYIRDVKTGAVWSSGYQPTARRPLSYEVAFSEERAVFRRVDAGILTQTDIVVSPEDDAEVRFLTITNQSSRTRELEVTSYAEVVIAPANADTAHRAFSSLFVETEHVPAENALIARRRPRSSEESPVFAVHTMAVEGETIGNLQFETSRSRFLGRGHDPRRPLALLEDRPLSNTVGPVLDPVFSLRQRVRLEPHETAKVTFSLSIAHSREQALQLADKYHDTSIFERVDRMSWTHAHVQMRHLNIEPREAHIFQRLGGRLLYSDSSLRARSEVLSQNRETQSSLWKYGIGGDLPMALVRVKDDADLEILRQVLRAHEYLRLKGLQFDLAILNSDNTSYLQPLQDEIQAAIRSAGFTSLVDKPGGVHVCRLDLMPDEDRVLVNTVARVVLDSQRGTLEEQLRRRPDDRDLTPVFVARAAEPAYPEQRGEMAASLQYFNGLGGFSQDGQEYVIHLNDGQWTPAPWANIIASEKDFGFQISEAGSSSTWAGNSRENRLTPWSNDAVSDPSGEAIYLRDEDTGTVWSPTPLPIREPPPYVVRHGRGYTSFEHESHDIYQELTVFVPKDETVKVSRLRLTNRSGRRRRISVTSYNELVMGVVREQSAPFVVTEIDNKRTIFARNSYNNEFASRIAFVAMSPSPTSATGDRRSFLGRNGTPIDPASLRRSRLDNRFGSGFDPCAALQTIVDIGPQETREILVLLGSSETRSDAEATIAQYLDPDVIDEALGAVRSKWSEVLSSVQVKTPDKAMELMLNGWLLYQTIASRIRARSAFYQSGGAYGFRDQLQDVMALVYSHPELTRAQILRAASRQFLEGDVQHWWHPPTGRGVRTRVSDDLLWLPYVVSFYCRVTGDRTVLDEVVTFLEGPALEETQHEAYFLPEVSSQSATVYEHCVRAIERSLATGVHGLPLMGKWRLERWDESCRS
jgi:cyclic beta-1,2-glucan synthetase